MRARSTLERRPFPSLSTDAAEPTIASLELLRLLEDEPELSQRELARRMGVSLGKTHYLLRALLERGWVKMQNFRASDTKLGYAYVLTPAGARQKLKLTRSFLARKEREYVELRTQISVLRKELQRGEAGAP